ncbi:hypothetical protein ACLJCJ_09465, partial [Campylobacter coli]|uniref:hypothetical protein n=1 Tax=Campylobacter coli TaxID=195 RepID=UPI003F7BC409
EEEKFKTYDCEYSIYQIEIGKKNQIIHIQGTLHFKNPRSFNKLKKDFPRAHIKAIKWGSDEAVFNYCGKSDTRVRGPYEKGNKPEPGSRTDLNDLKDAIMHGHLTVNQIRQDNPIIYHQYGRTLEALQTDYWNSNERSTMTKGVWLYGKNRNRQVPYSKRTC